MYDLLHRRKLHHWPEALRWSVLVLLLHAMCFSLTAEIVINEVLYDPIDEDEGYEWIELYNNGADTINLAGAKIQKGGATFATVYTFPSFLLRPGRFILIGEAQVSQAVFNTPLLFQNGGSATDGIRYVSPDELYTDTVLYDSPNANLLVDDSGNPGSSFAADVSAGYSLSRRYDGVDTNDCSADFIAEINPTPGLPNHVACDFAISSPSVYYDTPNWMLSVWIANRTEFVTHNMLKLQIKLDGLVCQNMDINPIAALDSTEVLATLPIYDEENHLVSLELQALDDIDTSNNSWSYSLQQVQPILPLINEFMYDPTTGVPEWIELYFSEALNDEMGFQIQDNSGNTGNCSLPEGTAGYIVICNDKDSFQVSYPDCPASNVYETTTWPQLNNTGDSIILKSEDATIDSVSYLGDSHHKGFSRERYLNDDIISWRYSLDPTGSTPGRQNSVEIPSEVTFSGRVKIIGSPCKPEAGASVRLYYNLPDETSKASCQVYDLEGVKQRSLASNVTVGQSGYIEWDGRNNSGRYVQRGLYIVLWESQSTSGGKIYRKQLTAVIDRN